MPSTITREIPSPVVDGAAALRFAPVLLVLAIALLQRFVLPPNADIAWYTIVAEKVLSGKRLYVDVMETNPPFAVWLYMPAGLLGRATGVRAEWIFDGMVFALGAASLVLCGALARGGKAPEFSPNFVAATLAVLFVLPASTFGEREHVALISILPFICIHAFRAEGGQPALARAVAAGLMCGLAFLTKPHFVLGAAPVVLFAMYRARSLRPAFVPENLIAAAMLLAYAARLVWFEPEFLSFALPLTLTAYVTVNYDLWSFFTFFVSVELSLLALAAITVWRQPAPSTLAVMTLLASAGFFLAVVAQAKGIPYHFYPTLALALLPAFHAGLRPPVKFTPALLLAAGLFAQNWTYLNAAFDMRLLIEPARRVAAHPRVAAIGYDFSVGPPIVRATGGEWVGTMASQWAADNVHWLLAKRKLDEQGRRALEDIEAWELQTLANDIRRGDPDVIFVQRGQDDWLPWAMKNSDLAAALDAYEPEGRYLSDGMRTGYRLEIELWRKKRPR